MNTTQNNRTTLSLSKEVKKELDRLKIHPNQSYSEVIKKILQETKGEQGTAETIPALASSSHLCACGHPKSMHFQSVADLGDYCKVDSCNCEDYQEVEQ